jgi:F0F1-type ATP synthase assembly protein I
VLRAVLGARHAQGAQGALAEKANQANIPAMKFFLAIFAYLVISVFLGWGILLTFKGNPWLLIIGFLAYAVAFGKLGCLPGKSH